MRVDRSCSHPLSHKDYGDEPQFHYIIDCGKKIPQSTDIAKGTLPRPFRFLLIRFNAHAVDGDGFGGALIFVHAGLGDGDIGRLHPVAEGAPGGNLRSPSGL